MKEKTAVSIIGNLKAGTHTIEDVIGYAKENYKAVEVDV